MVASHLHTKRNTEDVVKRPVSRHGINGREGHPDRQAHQLRNSEREIHLSDQRKLKLRAVALRVLPKDRTGSWGGQSGWEESDTAKSRTSNGVTRRNNIAGLG